MERAQMSINLWMDKEDVMYVYTHTHTHKYTMGYYSAMKKNEILSFTTTWMELECIMLSQVSQSEKDKYYMILFICRIQDTKQMNIGAPGWLSRLSVQLQLRSWSCSLWVRAPRQALCWKLGAWSCFGFCVSLSLCSSLPHTLSLHDALPIFHGAPGWLSRLSGRLRLRSWSHSLWVRAPRQALCWQPGACFRFCLLLSLFLLNLLSVSLLKTINVFKKSENVFKINTLFI